MTVKPDGVAIDGRLLQASGKAKELFRYEVASIAARFAGQPVGALWN